MIFRLSLLVAVCGVAHAQTCGSGSANSDGTCQARQLECNVYMAPSTLGEATNMGIYTGKDLKADEVVNYPEIAIPLLFREWGEHADGYDDGQLWDRYIWEGPVCDIETYVETDLEKSRAVFVPGVGCTVNSIMDMNNIESTHGSTYDTAGLHRSKDPGAGAFCPYHSSVTNAVVDIPAGAELFATYGDYWIPDIPGAQITLNPVMDKAENLVKKDLYGFMEDHEDMTDELKEALWTFTKEFPTTSQTFSVLPSASWSKVEERIKDNADNEKYSVVRNFIRKQSVKSIEWLEEFGYCQDHLKPGRSTIEQAGRGAFASRDLPEGAVIGYSPLVHMGIFGREVLDISYTEEDGTERHQYDLVYNYCFGHRNSTLILTPYGGMVNYINHSKEKANVKIRWPDRELVAHKPDWLTKDINFLRYTMDKIGLSFEYVALRDIAEGEEVFMDYGDEWEEAWNDYVANWKPSEDADKYMHSTEFKVDYLRTEEELETDPYPENIHTMCILSYTSDGDDYKWTPVLRTTYERVYCHVVERTLSEDGNTYLVRMEDGDEEVLVKGVPQDDIYLMDKVFTADWHQPGFRHTIMIPDDVIPANWLNGPPEDPF